MCVYLDAWVFHVVAFSLQVSTSRPPDHIVSTRKCEAKFQWDEEKENTIKSLALPVPVALIRRGGHTGTIVTKSLETLNIEQLH